MTAPSWGWTYLVRRSGEGQWKEAAGGLFGLGAPLFFREESLLEAAVVLAGRGLCHLLCVFCIWLLMDPVGLTNSLLCGAGESPWLVNSVPISHHVLEDDQEG